MSKFICRTCVALLATTSAIALALAACSPSGTQTSAGSPPAADAGTSLALPLTTGPLLATVAAPPVQDLPVTAPVRIARVSRPTDRYAYADQAYAMSRALGQAPPDYGVDYENTHPWVWRSQTNALQIVEPVAGGDRYYYFQPNAEDPYLIRDPQYAYAYADGALAVVYDRSGRALDPDAMSGMADWAGRYLSRGRGLYRAAAQGARRRVIAANWAERRAVIASARADWAAQQTASGDWRAYHAEHDAEQQAYWRTEQDQRDRSAQAYDHWRRDDYRTPPPAVTAYGGDVRSPSQGGLVAGLIGAILPRQRDQGDGRTDGSPRPLDERSAQQQALSQARQEQGLADRTHQLRLSDQEAARQNQQLRADADRAASLAAQTRAEANARERVQAEASRQLQARIRESNAVPPPMTQNPTQTPIQNPIQHPTQTGADAQVRAQALAAAEARRRADAAASALNTSRAAEQAARLAQSRADSAKAASRLASARLTVQAQAHPLLTTPEAPRHPALAPTTHPVAAPPNVPAPAAAPSGQGRVGHPRRDNPMEDGDHAPPK